MAAGDPLATALAGAIFGLALAAPPGPMNAVIAEESVVQGWLAGFVAGVGAMVADACFLLLALVGIVAVVQRQPTVRGVMVLAGGCLMLYFAYATLVDARRAFGIAAADGTDTQQSDTVAGPWDAARGFRRAFLLAITNPYQVAFWLTVGVGLLEPGTVDVLAQTPYVGASLADLLVVRTGSPLLIAGLFGGIVVWITGFPAVLVAAGRRVDRLGPAVALGSAVVLAGFGLFFLADGVTALR